MPTATTTAKPQLPVARYMGAVLPEAVVAAQAHLKGIGRAEGLLPNDFKGEAGPIQKGTTLAKFEGDRFVLTTPRHRERIEAQAAAFQGADVDGNGRIEAKELVATYLRQQDADRDGEVLFKENTRLFTKGQWISRDHQFAKEELGKLVRRGRVAEADERRELPLTEVEQLVMKEVMAAKAAAAAGTKGQPSVADAWIAGHVAGETVNKLTEATRGGKPLGEGKGVADFLHHASGAGEPRRPLLR